MKQYLLIFTLSLFGASLMNAQSLDSLQVSSGAYAATAFQVRPLDALMADALIFSPAQKVQELNVRKVMEEISLLKKEWSDYFALSGSFQAGNVQFIDNLSGGSVPDVRTVTRENIFLVGGLSLRIPLNDFVTKQERRNLLIHELEQEKYRLQENEMKVRELVIRQYQDLQRAIRILEIRARDLNAHQVAAEMAERYFREGSMPLDEYTEAINKRNEAEIRQENATMDAQLAFLLLRELVGTNIQ